MNENWLTAEFTHYTCFKAKEGLIRMTGWYGDSLHWQIYNILEQPLRSRILNIYGQLDRSLRVKEDWAKILYQVKAQVWSQIRIGLSDPPFHILQYEIEEPLGEQIRECIRIQVEDLL